MLPLHAQTELSLAMDGGSGEAAGWFAHEAIEDELRQRVVAYNLPLRLCVRVVLITMLNLAVTCTE